MICSTLPAYMRLLGRFRLIDMEEIERGNTVGRSMRMEKNNKNPRPKWTRIFLIYAFTSSASI